MRPLVVDLSSSVIHTHMSTFKRMCFVLCKNAKRHLISIVTGYNESEICLCECLNFGFIHVWMHVRRILIKRNNPQTIVMCHQSPNIGLRSSGIVSEMSHKNFGCGTLGNYITVFPNEIKLPHTVSLFRFNTSPESVRLFQQENLSNFVPTIYVRKQAIEKNMSRHSLK